MTMLGINLVNAMEGKNRSIKKLLLLILFFAVTRGPVDHSIVVSPASSCRGYEDGTKCIKRCIDLTCTSVLARYIMTMSVYWPLTIGYRCYEGHCKRFGHHPCDTSDNHSCCCGNCYLPKVGCLLHLTGNKKNVDWHSITQHSQ